MYPFNVKPTIVLLISFLAFINSSSGTDYPTLWESLTGARTNHPTGDLVKTLSGNAWTACGFSDNSLAASTNGYVKYTIESENGGKAIGLSVTDDGVSMSTIDYCWTVDLTSPGRLYIYENGTLIGSYGTPSAGAVLKVERDGSNIKYYYNSSLYRTVSTTASNVLHADCGIFTYGCHLNDVECSFNHNVYAYATITNLTESTRGEIELHASGGSGGYKYYWGSDYLTESEFDNLLDEFPVEFATIPVDYEDIFETSSTTISQIDRVGKIEFVVIDSGGDTYVSSATMSHDLVSQTLTGCSVSSGVITRTSNTGTSYEGLMYNGILSDEEARIEFSVNSTANTCIVGFRKSGDAVQSNGSHVTFAAKISSNNLYLVNNGTSTLAASSVNNLERFEIEIAGGYITVYRNGSSVLSQSISGSHTFYEDVYFSNKDDYSTIHTNKVPHINLRMDPRISVTDADCSDPSSTGSMTIQFPVSPSGGYDLYIKEDGSWDALVSGSYTTTYSSLAPGAYKLVANFGMTPYTYYFDIAYTGEWIYDDNATSASVSGAAPYGGWEFLKSSDLSNVGEAHIEAMLLSSNEGWIEISIPSSASNLPAEMYAFGFTPETPMPEVLWLGFGNLPACIGLTWNEGDGEFNFIDNIKFGNGITPHRLRIALENDSLKLYLIRGLFAGVPTSTTTKLDYEATSFNNVVNLITDALVSPDGRVYNIRTSFRCLEIFPSYATLSSHFDGMYYSTFNGNILVKYEEQYMSDFADVKFNIYDEAHSITLASTTGDILPVVFGYNTLKIDLTSSSLPPGNYTLEVINAKNEKSYLRFIYY